MKFIHLSDTHLLSYPHKIFDLNMKERLIKAIQSINKNHSDATFCAITGDITHWGESVGFEQFLSIMKKLNIPWHPIPGNHDTRNIFLQILKNLKLDDPQFIQYTIKHPEGIFLFLDTLDEGKASGILCETRLMWLKKELNKTTPESRVFILMHHAPMNVGIGALDQIKLSNSGNFKKLIHSHPQIRHLFFGHLHRTCHGVWAGIPFSAVKATAHQTVLNLNDKPLEVANKETPGYAIVLIKGDTTIIHNHEYLTEDEIIPYNRGRPKSSKKTPINQKG